MTGLQQVRSILSRYRRDARNGGPHVSTCANCGIWLQDSVTGSHDTDKGPVCSDCYFKEWGDMVEKHPISSPRRR